jgi:sulfite exporter TauE/SafE
MKARRFGRWVVRAALIGLLACGAVYAATAASASESDADDGAVWGASLEHVESSSGPQTLGAIWF